MATVTELIPPTAPLKAPLQPRLFDNAHFEIISGSKQIEEEMHEASTGRYCHVRIGQILSDRYQLVGKLGYGLGSTVWLAIDMKEHDTVALKVYTNDEQNTKEIKNYRHLADIKSEHVGRRFIRDMRDHFTIQGLKGVHQCVVHKPMWENIRNMLRINGADRFPEGLLRGLLSHLLLALDYLHTEAHLIHTDISAWNILVELADPSLIDSFIEAEQHHPSARKDLGGYTVYASRSFDHPSKVGEPVLSDFGAAVSGEIEHHEYIQPNVYRSPEVCLEIPWSYSVDIWNVGVMVWDLFEKKHMFYGHDPEHKTFTTRALLADMIAMLGSPPKEFLKRGKRSSEFFTEDGQWRGDIPLPDPTSLEESELYLEGANKKAFLVFMRKMLQWEPERRQTARQLLQDPWLNGIVSE